MRDLISTKYAVIDLTSFFERNETTAYDLSVRTISCLFHVMKTSRTNHIILATHDSKPIPTTLKEIFTNANFEIVPTTTYADFANFVDSSAILFTRDRIFYQFLKFFETSRIVRLYQTGEFINLNYDYLDCRYGTYHLEDYQRWSTTLPSRRLSFPGVDKTTLYKAYLYNQEIYKNTNAHRFYQRPVYLTQRSKTVIPFKENLHQSFNEIDFNSLKRDLNRYFPTTVNFLKRIEDLFARQDLCRKRLNSTDLK